METVPFTILLFKYCLVFRLLSSRWLKSVMSRFLFLDNLKIRRHNNHFYNGKCNFVNI